MKLPTEKDIKKLSPDEAKALLDKIDDYKVLIFNNWSPDSMENYWLNRLADEVTWEEFKENA